MDSFELNKIAGAVLGTLLLVMGLNIFAGIIFTPTRPTVPGYALPGETEGAPTQTAAAAPAEAPIAERLANADPARGERAVQACRACHTFEPGGPSRVGPNLHGVVDGDKAHVSGFSYSAAMRDRASKGEKWGVEELDAFLRNPRSYLPGTTMSFAGVGRPEQRADIVAYLQSLK